MDVSCKEVGVDFEADGGAVTALDGASLDVHQGDFVTLLGPSGCGKTTLLRVIAGLEKPTRGSVDFSGPGSDDPWGLLVRQENSLFPWMTALENAAFGLEMLGVPRSERESAAKELLEKHGLAGRETAYPFELSTGMKQRVAVIRAFLSDPPLLLMDEPFGAVDSQTRLKLQKALLQLWTGACKSVIFVTHDVDEALLLSDRVVILSGNPGRVIEEVPVSLAREDRLTSSWGPDYLELRRHLIDQIETV